MALFKKKKKLDTNSMEKGVYLVTVAKPTSVDTEQFNTIRTNITFSSADTEYKSLMITSSVASEGKSTTAANIAASFAKQGLSTLLVDADLRRPTIASTFGIADPRGLTNFLTDRDFDINDVIYETTVDNLFVIPAGPVPPNPSELMGSRRMDKLREALEPVLSVTDAQLLSAKVDGTLLIVRQGFAEKEGVRQAVDLLKHVNAHIIGAVLNDVDVSTDGYYGYYGYGKGK